MAVVGDHAAAAAKLINCLHLLRGQLFNLAGGLIAVGALQMLAIHTMITI
jgi:hypothetical protein